MEMTQEQAEKKLQEMFGTKCRPEYDPKMSALKCWLFQVGKNGYICGCFDGRTWEAAFEDLEHQRSLKTA